MMTLNTVMTLRWWFYLVCGMAPPYGSRVHSPLLGIWDILPAFWNQPKLHLILRYCAKKTQWHEHVFMISKKIGLSFWINQIPCENNQLKQALPKSIWIRTTQPTPTTTTTTTMQIILQYRYVFIEYCCLRRMSHSGAISGTDGIGWKSLNRGMLRAPMVVKVPQTTELPTHDNQQEILLNSLRGLLPT